MSFEDDMSEFDGVYDETEAATGGVLFSDGQHQAVINVSRVSEGQYGWQLEMGFVGTDTNTKTPATVRRWWNLPIPDDQLPMFKKDMKTLGYEGSPSGLNQACIDGVFIGLLCDIGVKRKMGDTREYVNVYINRCHGRVEGVVRAPSSEPDFGPLPSDEDIPF